MEISKDEAIPVTQSRLKELEDVVLAFDIKEKKELELERIMPKLGFTEPSAAGTAKTPTPAPTPSAGQWDYWLIDGRGPYSDVQAAMDALGLPKDKRPKHQRWDRLSTQLKEQIQRRPKV